MAEAKKCPQYFACLAAACIAFPTGIALGWTSPTVDDLLNGKYGFSVSKEEYSWISASLPLGGLLSSIPSGFFIDSVGFQLPLLLAVIPQMMAWLLIRIAMNVWFMYVGRFLLGMVCGTLFIAIPIYLCEIGRKDIRGNLCMLFNVLSYGGVFFIYTFGEFMDPMSLSILCLVMPMKFTVCPMFMPESPIFLIQKNKESEAKNSLRMLRGSKYDLTMEMMTIRNELDVWTKDRKSFIQNIKTRACTKALYIGCGLMSFQPLCGLSPMVLYTKDIFELFKYAMLPRFAVVIFGGILFGSTLIQMLFVEKLDRRIFLMISAVVIAVCHFILGFYFLCLSKNQKWTHDYNWLPLVSFCICSMGFALGFGTIPWIMIAEIFPPGIKGAACSFPLTVFWLLFFVIAKWFINIELSTDIHIAFFLFAGMTVPAFGFIYFLVPETRGKSLNEIVQFLDNKIN